jgi:hypothetical protein
MRTTNSSTLSLLSLLSLSAVLTGAAAGCDAVEEDLGEVTLRPWGCSWCTNTGNSATSTARACPTGISTVAFGEWVLVGLGPLEQQGVFKLRVAR